MRNLEKRPDIAWIRIELHNDTEIAEYDEEEVLAPAEDSPIICTSLSAMELDGEELVLLQNSNLPDGFKFVRKG